MATSKHSAEEEHQRTETYGASHKNMGVCKVKRGLIGFYKESVVVLDSYALRVYAIGTDPAIDFPDFIVELSGGTLRVGGYSFVVKDAVGHKVTLKCTAEDHTSWMQAFKRVHSLSRRIHDFYEVGHVVGEGATCKVYEAWCKVTGRRVALKTRLDPTSVDGLKALHNEVKMLELCTRHPHPAIPLLLDHFYDSSGGLHMVSEFMDGGELFARIVQRDHLTEDEARSVFRQVAEGVAHLHAMRMAHRDLKPENLMFATGPGGAEQVKIVDFDLARLDDSPAWCGNTPCGTLSYMAPEIVLRRKYSQAVDMWSLGCILYILLSGRKPFGGATEEARKENIKRARVFMPPKLFDGVSDAAKSLVSALLVKNPADRLTAQEVLRHKWLAVGAPRRPLATTTVLQGMLSPDTLASLKEGPKYAGHHTARRNLYSNRGIGNIGNDAIRQQDDPHPDDPRPQPDASSAPSMLNLFGLMPLVTGYLSGGGDTGAVAHLTWGQDIKGGQGDGARSSGCDTAESAVSEASGAGRVARASTEGTASGKRWWRGRRKNRDRDRESLEDFKMRCELGAGPPVATGHRMSVDRPMCMGMSPSPSAARLDAMS